jgi:hypothetical protein
MEKRLTHAHHTAPCRPLNPQPRMKHFQLQILPQIGCSNMFMLGFRPGTVPSWRFNFHLKVERFETNTSCNSVIASFNAKIRFALVAGLKSDTNNIFYIQCHFEPPSIPTVNHSCIQYNFSRKRCNLFRMERKYLVFNILR